MAIDKQTQDLIFKAGIVVGGYFLVVKPLLEKLGLKKTAEQEAQEETSKKGREKFIEDALAKPVPTQFNKGKAYFPEGQYALFADQIYEFLNYSYFDSKPFEAYKVMLKMRNDGDIAMLVKYYGIRQLKKFGLPVGNPKNLSQTLVSELTKEQLKQLRDWFRTNKLKYTI